jgi:PAS domain S-box-containing protein
MLSLFTRLLRLSVYFRRQIPIFAIASALPIVSNILYVTGLNPIPSLDWTPLAFGFMSILLTWGVLQQKHFKVVPIAPERLSDYLAEGIIVLDSQDRIVELNVALQRLFDFSLKDVVGRLLAEVVGTSEEMRVLLASEGEQRAEVALEARGLLRVFEARLLPLSDWRGRATGRLLVLRDITADKLLAQGREDLIQGLQEALAHVKMLQGLLPICANCKRIRDDQGYWHSVESYISEHSDATFTHGLCPDCARELYPELFKDRDERVG